MPQEFRIIAFTPPGLLQPALVIAAGRAGGLGVLDLEYVQDEQAARAALRKIAQAGNVDFGVKLDGDEPQQLTRWLTDLPATLRTVILSSRQPENLQEPLRLLRQHRLTVLLEVNCLEQALAGKRLGVDGLIAKGHEAGGRIAGETTFILLQRLLARIDDLPIYAQGGVGLHTAAACAAAGAAGVALDSQLLLLRESRLAEPLRSRLAGMDGSETLCVGEQLGDAYRVYSRPGSQGVEELRQLEARLACDGRAPPAILSVWRHAVQRRVGWDSDRHVLLLGQDAGLAAALAKRFATVGGVIQGIQEAVQTQCEAARRLRPLDEQSPLARSHGTRYPILQGPMTRVSDVPEFAAQVAEGGALPFLALALLRGPDVKTLLAETQQRLGQKPWGVGILGFVPPELRQEQMDVIRDYRPPFALIAGGRPDQARALEQQGIPTYLHVPSPGLLRIFLQQGARRFVFEGRECGGHVGPRASFVLWNQMVDVLLEALATDERPEDYHLVFAGGVHDALSAAMVATLAAPLAARGARLGVIMGTAYLFTKEAVAAGAILKGFQEQAGQCQRTVLLETGPGHATRCVDTPFAAAFTREKSRLSKAGVPADEMRLLLEELNLGRLRIASKGVTRNPRLSQDPKAPQLLKLSKSDQLAQGMYMIGQVAALRDEVCTIAALHHDVAVASSNRLQTLAERWTPAPAPAPTPSDIAIVGMSCLLPKAGDLQTYWENILGKVNAITEVPKDRWDWERYFDADPKARDKIYSKWGGFLDDLPFDPMQYGMPPATLRSIEPAQLLTLQAARAALQDAGYLERPFPRERTAVILGAGGGAADLGLSYGARAFMPLLENLPELRGRSQEIIDRLGDHLPEWTEDSFAGILTNVAAGRVANRFDLGGPNYTVDAACASSLAAVSLAVRELETRGSDLAIVGGVDTMQNPFTFLCFSKTQALSPRGRCRAFDESADGIAISEGVVMLVLKRLADAERDGDRIYAVIKGVGEGSDGKDRGLTAPRPEGQARALRRAYEKAGLSPATVGLVEAHGTGTVAGDQAEIQALTQVFSEAEAERQRCAIGSVKSMIGHTKCSAGAAGLIKAALALHHKALPPTLGVEKPNASARFPETPFFINTEARPWMAREQPRRAGVSAFGFGGTNFHVVLEEYDGGLDGSRAAVRQWPGELLLWRADSCEGLLKAIEPWEQALAGGAQPALRDLAYTTWRQTAEQPAAAQSLRLAMVAASLDELKQKLASARQALTGAADRINDPRGIYFSQQPWAADAKLAFLFPGQGSQQPDMLRELAIYFPIVQAQFELGDRVLADRLEQPLSAYIFPPSSFSPEEERARREALTQTWIAQPAIGAASLGMLRLLQGLGLQPAMAAGHSYGEYTALAAAGAFSAETLLALSEARGRFIIEAAGAEPGVMAAVEAAADVVAQGIEGLADVWLANANAPRQTVIAGSRTGVEQAVERFAAQNVTARLIPVACAFHSPLVAAAQHRLAEFLTTVKLAEPRFPVYSNTTAAPYPEQPAAVAAQLAEHLARPVEFAREIEAMYAAGARIFVEVGPRSVLTGLVERILADRPKLAVASNQNGRSDLIQLLHLLGQLAAHGAPVVLDRLYDNRDARRLDPAALARETGPKPLPPSTWLVNGARARPLHEPAQRTPREDNSKVVPLAPRSDKPHHHVHGAAPKPAAMAAPAPAGGSTPAFTPSGGAAPAVRQTEPAPAVPPALPAVAAVADEGLQQAMAQFQQLMNRFLETQKSIMLAYLENGAAGPALPAPAAGVALPATVPPAPCSQPALTPEPVIAVLDAASAPPTVLATAPPPGAAGPTAEDLTGRLLAIVSERTGYPAEMLGLDMDLEADLGIDSIKRVEILGKFQQALADVVGGADDLMEKLAGARTLRVIIERVATPTAPAPTQPVTPAAGAGPVAPAGSSPSPTVAAAADLTGRLLAIVSERTGYPADMLGLDMDLEADLGIDSIKRVEILGKFQQALADVVGGADGSMEKLAGARTLRAIIERVTARLDSPSVSAQTTAPVTAPVATAATVTRDAQPDEDNRIQRYTLLPVDAPLQPTAKTPSRERVIVITDDGRGVARLLMERLLEQGYKVARIELGRDVLELEKGVYSGPLDSADQVAQLLELVRRRQGPLGGVAHLLPLQAGADFAALDFDSWKARLRLETKSLFYLVKAAGAELDAVTPSGAACVLAATGMGGAFMTGPALAGPAPCPGQGGVVGLIKTLALEQPRARAKAVDLDLGEAPAVLAGRLLDELLSGDERVEVGYCQDRRLTLDLQAAPLPLDTAPALALDESAVILITGGARGITAQVARRLAERYRPTLVLVGRSPLPPMEESPATAALQTPPELKAALLQQLRQTGQTVTPAQLEHAYGRLLAEREIRANLAALQRAGAKAHYHSLDVRDAAAFGEFIDQIYARCGRLDGVIHGAGVIEDKLLQDKSPDSFERVFDTKVDSAFVLSRKLRPDTLRFLILFASVAGRFGNRGQADYAAANEVLAKLAAWLDRQRPGRVTAMAWGPWDNAGMVSPELRRQFAERGVELIPLETGLRRLEQELNHGCKGDSEVVIGGAGWRRAEAASPTSWPLLSGTTLNRVNGYRELVRTLDPARDRYLDDHRIDGQPVLPLAVAMELMAETAAQGWPELQVSGLHDLYVLQGVVLANGPKTVCVRVTPQTAATTEAVSVLVEIMGAEQPQRLHYRATVELARRLPEPPGFAPTPVGPPPPRDVATMYRQWLFHGPQFQGIRAVGWIDRAGVGATLATSEPRRWLADAPAGPWLIDPLLFDSGLQLLILWTRQHWDMTTLPSRFKSYRRFGAPSGQPVACELRIRPESGGHAVHGDIYFIDGDGRVLGMLEDIEGACSAALNRLGGKETQAATGEQA